jgi:hypothetical protein
MRAWTLLDVPTASPSEPATSQIRGRLAEKTRRRGLKPRRRALTRVAGQFEKVSSSPEWTRNYALRINAP